MIRLLNCTTSRALLMMALCIIHSATAIAQVVTTSPAVIQQSSAPIVITFHADQGSKGLMGQSPINSIYAHTGVITNASTSSSDWQYATTWLDNSTRYKMKYVSANTWQLTISNIRDFYGITDTSVEVKQLAFVFRSSDGKKEGKTADGGDIFVDVFPDTELKVVISSDATSEMVAPGTILNIKAVSSSAAKLQIFESRAMSTALATADNATEITYTTAPLTIGEYTYIARGESGEMIGNDTLSISCVGESTEKQFPGGTPKMGQTINTDGTVTFCVAAPKKSSAMIVGSWDNYAKSQSGVMYYQDWNGSRYFWATIDGIKPGVDYIYYYIIDGTKNVCDPYARLVLDPWNDKYISSEVYPDMPEYPSNKISGIPVAVFNTAQDTYNWKVNDFKGASNSELIIYELLIRDFTGTEGSASGEGNIAGVMSKLDYLQSLGVNAIELLPIMEFNGNNSWGYNPNFYFAPDKAYGTRDAYRALIDEIHSRGMAVILDIVLNQSDGLHPWYQMYDIKENPFYNAVAPHSYSVLNDWNQDNEIVQQQWKDALQYWLTAYKVDGFRFDLVKGLGDSDSYGATYNSATNAWSGSSDSGTNSYNATRVARMKWLHDAMREVNPNAYFINENLAQAAEENSMALDGEMNWANINDASCQFAMGYSSNSNMNRFYAPLDSRYWGSTVSYAESHDEERMAYKAKQYGTSGVKDNEEIIARRLGSVAAQMLLTPGAHMIWQFQEIGADETTKNSSGGNNTDPKKVIWSYLDNEYNAGLMQSYRELCNIRKSNPELFADSIYTQPAFNTGNWSLGRSLLLRNGNKELFCVINPNISGNLTIKIGMQSSLSDCSVISKSYGTNPVIEDGSITLPAGAYAVIGTSNMSGVVTPSSDTVKAYGTQQGISITGEYSQAHIYSITGQEMNNTDVPSGIYIVVVDGVAHKVLVNRAK